MKKNNKKEDNKKYGYYGNNPIELIVYKYIAEELSKEFHYMRLQKYIFLLLNI